MSILESNLVNLPTPSYKYITTTNEAINVLQDIEKHVVISVDTETTGLDVFEHKIVLLQISAGNNVYIFDVRDGNVDIKIFKRLFESETNLKLFQNAVFDCKFLKYHYDITVRRIYDTMLSEQLLYLGLKPPSNLQHLVSKYLHLYMPKEPSTTFKDYYQEYNERQLMYAANDVIVLPEIYNIQKIKLKNDNLLRAAKLEFDFIRALVELELNGMLLDVDKWLIILESIKIERDRLGIQLQDILNRTSSQNTIFGVSLINLDSPVQLVKALNELGINVESTDVKELAKYGNNSIVKLLLDYRKKEKFLTTYGEALLNRIHPKTGRLHSEFKQMVDTGRMSSSNPNLQNIPAEKDYRSCFIARDGHKLITSDMSQAELRILAAYSKDAVFLEAFEKGLDLHARTAADLFDVTYEEVLEDKKLPDDNPNKKHYRSHVKALNFGLCLYENTYVLTTHGYKFIKDINIGDIVIHDIGKDEVIDKKYMGKKKIIKITTKYGYNIKLTLDHIVKVIDNNGKYVDKAVKDLAVGDYLCINFNNNVFNNDFIFNDVDEDIPKVTSFKDIAIPEMVTDDLASFLGLFVSEGSIIKKKGRKRYSGVQFGFSKKDGVFISKIRELLGRLFGSRAKVYNYDNSNYIHFSINSVKLAEYLRHIFTDCFNSKCDSIYIPKIVMCGTYSVQTNFLRWLFSGDGTIKKNGHNYKISYTTKSERLAQEIQLLLLNFGILSSVTSENRNNTEDNYYTISILQYFNDVFMRRIGFISKKILNNGTTNVKSCYFVPYQKDKLVKMLDTLKFDSGRKLYDSIYNCINYIKDYGVGNILLPELYIYDDFLKFIHTNNIVPLPIENIVEVGSENVYDISINNHPYYIANGLIVHNCYGLTKTGLARRLGISETKAQKLIDMYFSRYKNVAKWLDDAGKFAVKNGYSVSRSGRRRYYRLPDPSSPDFNRIKSRVERQGKNMPIQGCLCGDTIIAGYGPLKELLGEIIVFETGFGKNSGIVVYSGKRKLYTVTMSNGVVLKITSEHKIPVITDDGELFDKTIFEINKDKDFLLIPLYSMGRKITDLSEYVDEKHCNRTYISYNYPFIMNEKLAFVIGCLIGDGTYSKHNFVRFVCPYNQKELFYKFNSYIIDIFGYKPKITEQIKQDNILLISGIYSVAIRWFLKHAGLDFVTHRDKIIPNYFFSETIKNKAALLNGLFSTDGGITSESGPNYTTVSCKLARDIQQLLLSLGINSNLKTYTNEYGEVYRLQIPKRFINKFMELIDVSVNVKHEALVNEIATSTGKDKSFVPKFIPQLIYTELRKSPNYKLLNYNEKCHLRRLKAGSCSFTSWRKFYNLLPNDKIKEYLSFFINYDFCKIKSISDTAIESDAYDIICDKEPHYFIANGIIVHNSNADTIKQAMIYIVDRIDNAKLLSTVHDEVIVEAKNEDADEVAYEVSKALCDGFAEFVPEVKMKADAIINDYWTKG